MEVTGSPVTDDEVKANMLNNFFSSVFTVDNGIIPKLDCLVDSSNHLDDLNFTVDGVYKILTKFKPKHTAEPDGYSDLLSS
jgi:hypothetical protein